MELSLIFFYSINILKQIITVIKNNSRKNQEEGGGGI